MAGLHHGSLHSTSLAHTPCTMCNASKHVQGGGSLSRSFAGSPPDRLQVKQVNITVAQQQQVPRGRTLVTPWLRSTCSCCSCSSRLLRRPLIVCRSSAAAWAAATCGDKGRGPVLAASGIRAGYINMNAHLGGVQPLLQLLAHELQFLHLGLEVPAGVLACMGCLDGFQPPLTLFEKVFIHFCKLLVDRSELCFLDPSIHAEGMYRSATPASYLHVLVDTLFAVLPCCPVKMQSGQ